MDELTPMMKQYHEMKRRYPGKLLFFRLGDFYELFYEDAVQASRELEITLTSRNRDRSGAPIPMCGVPYHAVDSYVARLLRKGFKIAVCEQVEDPRTTKKLVRREITRILTPGTVVEEMLLEPKDHNYLGSLCLGDRGAGIAFLDLSTADFVAMETDSADPWPQITDEISRFQPRELICAVPLSDELRRKVTDELGIPCIVSTLEEWTFNHDYGQRLLLEQLRVSSLAGFGGEGKALATRAAGALIHYLRETQLANAGTVASLRYYTSGTYLTLDSATMTNLELVQTTDGNKKGSLLAILDQTQTGMGGRLLRTWLLAPELRTDTINERLDCVEALLRDQKVRDGLRQVLSEIHDLERLASRVSVGTANPREMLALKDSLVRLPEIHYCLTSPRAARLNSIRDGMDLLSDVVTMIESAISDDPPAMAGEPGVIRSGYSDELDQLRTIRQSGKGYIASLEARERTRTGIASLKVKFNQVFGYFIEVTRPNLPLVPADYVRKQTLANCERFVTEELQTYEEKVLSAEEKISQLEKELFLAFRNAVAGHAPRILSVARMLAEIDVFQSLADVAVRRDYVRPVLDSGDSLLIRDGRHPVVEIQTRPFIPNDVFLNTTANQLLILTGPNMGGKSTYLRQTALIVIMAQAGSFVPAREARIGAVDRIYTRVGASDNLARGRSTFMVEMIETANILNTATPRSLILLDEVGRGTATFDGLSIAWAVAEYLVQNDRHRAKTLFATHYHELTKLADIQSGVKNYCMSITEAGNEIVFLRKVVPGVADKSYGVEVARLAGLPGPVIRRAAEILARLERKEIDLTQRSKARPTDEAAVDSQRTLF